MKKSLLVCLAFGIFLARAQAQVPQILNYQGRISVGSTNFTGSGQFEFALVNQTSGAVLWSNDGTNGQPTHAVSLTVTKGLYSVLLGDTSIANMTAAIPYAVFTNPDVRLRVWFNDGTNGLQQLSPDQRLSAAGYALMAGGVDLPTTTSATNGTLEINGSPFLHSFGANNSFLGIGAGNFSMTGSGNTALGGATLSANTSGSFNVAVGQAALVTNSAGSENVASGFGALLGNTAGNNNTAMGYQTLNTNSTGSANIALGVTPGGLGAGSRITGSNNIDLGHAGVAGDANIIRIGDGSTQTDIYLTGKIHGDGSALTGLTFSGTTTVSGNLSLAPTTSASAGVLQIGGDAFLQAFGPGGIADGNISIGDNAGNFTTTGTQNTALGSTALHANTAGVDNTAVGYRALTSNTNGGSNTALGDAALLTNTSGTDNTAVGYDAMRGNMTGNYNTALGVSALLSNTNGAQNTATGMVALQSNSIGADNVATGYEALYGNTTAGQNVAVGSQALFTQSYSNSNAAWASDNVAVGYEALYSNQPTGTNNGFANTATGWKALYSNVTGSSNTAVGSNTLGSVNSGSSNIALGSGAGGSITMGNFNIDIGNAGVSGDNGIIRIGDGSNQGDTYLTGVIHGNGTALTGVAQLGSTNTFSADQTFSGNVNANGNLGVLGNETVTGNLKVQNDTTLSGKLGVTGATTVGSTLGVTGKSTLTGSVTTGADLTVGTSLTVQLNATVLSLNVSTGSTLGGITVGTFSGNGANLSSLNASNVITGTLPNAQLPASPSLTNLALSGVLNLPATSSSTVGVVNQGGVPLLHTKGTLNTFVGNSTGNFTLTGGGDTGLGSNALAGLGSGGTNTAVGYAALSGDSAGSDNTAIGANAASNITGSSNIVVGSSAGSALTTGNNNIDIGNAGASAEAATIRLGTSGTQTRAFVAGISGVTVSGGATVVIGSNGQLGTSTSSRRFKTDIADMNAASSCLLALRPVTFRYKPELDPKGIAQWGLIAEEVAAVNPDLVVRDEQGQIQTVRYEQVNAMLLNEFLKDHRRADARDNEIAELKKHVADLERKDREREARLAKLEQSVEHAQESGSRTVALRVGE